MRHIPMRIPLIPICILLTMSLSGQVGSEHSREKQLNNAHLKEKAQVNSQKSPLPLVTVVPLGDPSPDLVEFVAQSVRDRLYFQVEISDPVALGKEAWYAPRKRWRADALLDQLDALELKRSHKVIGFTEKEISTTKGERYDWGIAGLGQLSGQSCVLTSYLFRKYKKKGRKRYLRYMENLVLHELGHTLGLGHCPLDKCIMADAKGSATRAARLSINEFCPVCHGKIQQFLRYREVRGDWN